MSICAHRDAGEFCQFHNPGGAAVPAPTPPKFASPANGTPSIEEGVSVTLRPLQWEAILRALMIAGRAGLHAELTHELAAQNHQNGSTS